MWMESQNYSAHMQAGNIDTALLCSPKKLLGGGEGTGHSADKVFSMALEFELALHRPASQHPLVRRQGPQLLEVQLGEVIVDQQTFKITEILQVFYNVGIDNTSRSLSPVSSGGQTGDFSQKT